jgi:hypothetical protein
MELQLAACLTIHELTGGTPTGGNPPGRTSSATTGTPTNGNVPDPAATST